jgi:hypothetical protein
MQQAYEALAALIGNIVEPRVLRLVR